VVFEVIIVVVSLPFRLWCLIAHRRRSWVMEPFGWGWVCEQDGFSWPFSEQDVRRIIG
jgi:hypothetical protein